MTSRDTEFLKQRIQRESLHYSGRPANDAEVNARMQSAPPRGSILDSTDAFLDNVTADEPDVLSPRQRRLKRIAESQGANDPERAAKIQAEEEKEEAEKLEKQRQKDAQLFSDRASRVVTSASESVNPLIDKVGSLPTVGGIGLLVLILVILLFTVVVVNDQGDTRMKQLWYMLNGRATIKGRQTVEAAIPGTGNTIIPGGGVSGNFGGGGVPPSDNTAVTHNSGSDLGF